MANAYDKVIIQEEEGEKTIAIIFNLTTHAPEFYKLVKMGMDDVLETLNKKND